MRRRAEELGIRYSPLPPYEVLQTNEISVNELQTARQLSRLLDGFYNTTAWQAITRKLILDDNDFLRRFLEFLIDKNLIDQPMSLEKRGLVLYEFCSMHYPAYKIMVTIAWIEAGMSLKKKTSRESQDQAPDATGILGKSSMETTKKASAYVFYPLTTIPKMVIGSASNRKYKKQNQYSKPKK